MKMQVMTALFPKVGLRRRIQKLEGTGLQNSTRKKCCDLMVLPLGQQNASHRKPWLPVPLLSSVL